jgi:hypothetical protein
MSFNRTVTFSSYRPSVLFALLGPLKRLDPELADDVIGENRELRRALNSIRSATRRHEDPERHGSRQPTRRSSPQP